MASKSPLHANQSKWAAGTTGDWEMPLPLVGNSKRPKFNIDACFPDDAYIIKQMVLAQAESLQVPLESAASIVLPIGAVAAAHAAEIELRQDWREPLAIWVANLAPPGERKSQLLSNLMRPIYAWEARVAEERGLEIARLAESRAQLVARLMRLRSQIARGSKDAGPLRKEAAEIAEKLATTPEPRLPRLVTDEPTPEAVPMVLAAGGERAILATAEADAIDNAMGRYADKGGSRLGVYLKAYSGDPIRIDRRGRPPEHLSRPLLSMALTVQPESMRTVFSDRAARGRGFLARFQMVWPTSRIGFRNTNPNPVPVVVAEDYYKTLTNMLNWERKVGEPKIIRLSHQAQAVFDSFTDYVETQLAPCGDLSDRRDWGGKLCGTVARIALALHSYIAASRSFTVDGEGEISKETILAAIAWAETFAAHERIVRGDIGLDMSVILADRLLKALGREPETFEITERELRRYARGPDIRSEHVNEAIDLLQSHGYLRLITSEERPQVGRPSVRFAVNPLWNRGAPNE